MIISRGTNQRHVWLRDLVYKRLGSDRCDVVSYSFRDEQCFLVKEPRYYLKNSKRRIKRSSQVLLMNIPREKSTKKARIERIFSRNARPTAYCRQWWRVSGACSLQPKQPTISEMTKFAGYPPNSSRVTALAFFNISSILFLRSLH